MWLLEVNVDTILQNRFVFLIVLGFFFHGKVPSFSLNTKLFFFFLHAFDLSNEGINIQYKIAISCVEDKALENRDALLLCCKQIVSER